MEITITPAFWLCFQEPKAVVCSYSLNTGGIPWWIPDAEDPWAVWNVLDSGGSVCSWGVIRADRRGPQGNRNMIMSNHVTFLSQDSRWGLQHFLRQNALVIPIAWDVIPRAFCMVASSCASSVRSLVTCSTYPFLTSVPLKPYSFSCIINLHHKILFTFLGTLRRVLVFLARMEFLWEQWPYLPYSLLKLQYLVGTVPGT